MGASYESVDTKLIHYQKEKEEYEKKKKETIENGKKFSQIYNNNNKTKKIIENGKKFSQIYNNNNKTKKISLNIIYYDESLKDSGENSDNCSFLEMNTIGNFYGCHYFDLFKLVCEKIKGSKKRFVVISSGSCAEKIFSHSSNIEELEEYYIYCFRKDKYIPLMSKYPKLKGVYNIFEDLKNALYQKNIIEKNNIKSSNLIIFNDYIKTYIRLHYEFIRKYSIYKLLKLHHLEKN